MMKGGHAWQREGVHAWRSGACLAGNYLSSISVADFPGGTNTKVECTKKVDLSWASLVPPPLVQPLHTLSYTSLEVAKIKSGICHHYFLVQHLPLSFHHLFLVFILFHLSKVTYF